MRDNTSGNTCKTIYFQNTKLLKATAHTASDFAGMAISSFEVTCTRCAVRFGANVSRKEPLCASTRLYRGAALFTFSETVLASQGAHGPVEMNGSKGRLLF